MQNQIKFKRLKRITKSIISDMSDPFYLTAAPGLAYYFLLSVAPITLSLSYFASFFFVGSEIMTEAIQKYMPSQLSDILVPFFSQQSATAGLTTTVVFFIFTLYLASRGCYALIKIADYSDGNLAAPTLREAPKMFIFRHIKAIILTLLMILIIVISLIIMVFGKAALDITISYMDLSNASGILHSLYNYMSYPLTASVIFLILVVFYAWMPTERMHLGEAVPGAVLSTLGIFVASFGFLIYIKFFFRSNAIYGALSSIIILILWFFILSFVLILGMVLNDAFRKNPRVKTIISDAKKKQLKPPRL